MFVEESVTNVLEHHKSQVFYYGCDSVLVGLSVLYCIDVQVVEVVQRVLVHRVYKVQFRNQEIQSGTSLSNLYVVLQLFVQFHFLLYTRYQLIVNSFRYFF